MKRKVRISLSRLCFQNTLSFSHHLLSFTKAVKLPSALFKCPRDGDLAATCLSSSCKDFIGHPSPCTAEPYQSGDTQWPEMDKEATAGDLSLDCGLAMPSSESVLTGAQARTHCSSSQVEVMDRIVGRFFVWEAGGSFPILQGRELRLRKVMILAPGFILGV